MLELLHKRGPCLSCPLSVIMPFSLSHLYLRNAVLGGKCHGLLHCIKWIYFNFMSFYCWLQYMKKNPCVPSYTQAHPVDFIIAIVSFIIPWVETWVLDYQVLPREKNLREGKLFLEKFCVVLLKGGADSEITSLENSSGIPSILVVRNPICLNHKKYESLNPLNECHVTQR